MTDNPHDPQRLVDELHALQVAQSARRSEAEKQARAIVAALTEQEVMMLRHLIAGWSKAESAAALALDPHAMDKARARLLNKLNAQSMTDAVRIGIYADLD